jgi:hypothetical protein
MVAIYDFCRNVQMPYLGSTYQSLFTPVQKLFRFLNFKIARGGHLGFLIFVTNGFKAMYATYENPLSRNS